MMKNTIPAQHGQSKTDIEKDRIQMAEPGSVMSYDTSNSGHGKGMVPVDTTMTRLMKRKRDHNCMQWLDYDVDIVDNMSKTKRFMSESVSDDIVSKMSFSEEKQDTGMLSPSPLSRRELAKEKVYGNTEVLLEEEQFATPRKSGSSGKKTVPHTGLLMQSPSDMKIDEMDLRKVALVRLALRNRRSEGEEPEGGVMR